ncbi:ERCC4 domain-containing protein [Microlunatus flavus]|uniref:Lsr2 protein n=1 Tax=Microlunatus flavus TaxID=1036181 RepID=A0A1H9C7J7_9ACTN|nr:ERCC4 domain-containing protein [Microlunatus flavus]SEP97245.1 Lsr2 protein [Microlunatus flavus]
MDLLVARNPDEGSSLPFLVRVPLGDGLVFRTKGTWPRTSALYCHPVSRHDWPAEPDLVEQVPLSSCVRRGAAIDLVAQRGRESRSQIVYTQARGREVVFWQAPRTRKQARPDVSLPSARAAGIADLVIVVDTHERYPYRFAGRQASTERRALRSGDYAVEHAGTVVAAVERKSLEDLTSSLTSGRLRFALAELAALPRAAVVVEERYSRVFAQEHVRPAVVADGLAELQVRYPGVPIVFCETRKLAEEWTYRYLAAALRWFADQEAADRRVAAVDREPAVVSARADESAGSPQPTTADVRRWAFDQGLPVSDRGRLKPEILQAWAQAHADETPT